MWNFKLFKDVDHYRIVEHYNIGDDVLITEGDLEFPSYRIGYDFIDGVEDPTPNQIRDYIGDNLLLMLKDLYRNPIIEHTTNGYENVYTPTVKDVCRPIFMIEHGTNVTKFSHKSIEYKLITYKYAIKKDSWCYSKGVLCIDDSNVLEIPHRYHSFPHNFVVYKDIPYLISAGESYMEMMITRLTDFVSETVSFRHEQFCPFSFNVIGDELHVVGCYWAASWDNYKIFDFTDPINLVQNYDEEKLEIWEDVFYHHGPKEVCWVPPEDQKHLYTEREGHYVRYFIFDESQEENQVYFKTISEAEEYLKEYGKRVEPRQNYEWLKSLGWR